MQRIGSVNLSPAQQVALERAARAPSGVLERIGPRSFGNRSWERMMNKLCAVGLFTPYVHGGYEITAAGRSLLRETTNPRPAGETRSGEGGQVDRAD